MPGRDFKVILFCIPGQRFKIFEVPAANSKLYINKCTRLYIYNRIQLYRIVYNCIQSYTIVYKCIQSYTTVYNCMQLYTIVYNCINCSRLIKYNVIQIYIILNSQPTSAADGLGRPLCAVWEFRNTPHAVQHFPNSSNL